MITAPQHLGVAEQIPRCGFRRLVIEWTVRLSSGPPAAQDRLSWVAQARQKWVLWRVGQSHRR